MFGENKTKGTLILDGDVFSKLHQELISKFRVKYEIDSNLIIDYQLYGFNNFDENLPSIKKMIDSENGLYLNGKYLYNKWRLYKNGAKLIKLSREFSFAYFHTLGYKDVYDFLDRSEFINEKDKNNQYGIFEKKIISNDKEYYVGYYIGENKSVIKTKLTISIGLKEVEWVLYYWEENKLSTFVYHGTILDLRSIITVLFKKENSNTDRDAYMSIYYGNEKVMHKPFLKGIYAGYDFNVQPVSGEIVFQRVSSTTIQEEMAQSKGEISPVIENYLYNKRLIIQNILPQNILELSNYSQYINNIERIQGYYSGFSSTSNEQINFIKITIFKSGKIKLIINNSVYFSGLLQIDNNDLIFVSKLESLDRKLKLSIALNGNTEEKLFLTGYFMGASELGNINVGKFCIINSKSIDKKINLHDEFLQFENNNLSFLYSDLFKKLISLSEAQIGKKDNKKESSFLINENFKNEQGNALKRIYGDYYLIYQEKESKKNSINEVNINLEGKIIMKQDQFIYLGDAISFSSGLLSLNFTSQNSNPFYFQVMIFIGKHSSETTNYFKGVANFLNNDLRPSSYTVFLIPKNKFVNFYSVRELEDLNNNQRFINELVKIGIDLNVKNE
jgi:hypothetical protein